MQSPSAGPEPERSRRRRVKVVDEIIETLRQEIVTRRLPHGGRLPSEKELSDRFQVSQPTVREAIRALETLGLVEVFHGNGTFVRSQGDYALASALQTLLQLQRVGIMEVLDVRQVLGRHSIEVAAVNATAEDIAAIEAASARFYNPGDLKDVDEVIRCVIEFQRVVSAASRRPILQSLEAFLLALLNEVQVTSLTGRGIRFWRARAMEFQPHRIAILEGLRASDPVAARWAIDRYFEAQRARFDQDEALRSIDLASPKLVTIVADMVRLSRD
ncbi:FadR/GntR family transcriptional regulator [uncultured Sphingomonas sp.]|uniref:FadR/GntR family transcriptional regulator n=1 Tax=uncultured Sphingomonas sp. TaxID=158754 RepID=UPI0035CA70A5